MSIKHDMLHCGEEVEDFSGILWKFVVTEQEVGAGGTGVIITICPFLYINVHL